MHYTNASLKQMKDRKGKPWRGTLQYKDAEGNWRQKTKVFSGVQYKRDAQVALNAWRAEMEEQAQRELSNDLPQMTVEKAVRDYLARQRKMNILTLGTYQNQLSRAEMAIFPIIGSKDFYELASSDVSNLISVLTESLKPRSVQNVCSILKKTYRDAMQRGKVQVNPCINVQLPKAKREQINYLDIDGRRKFLSLLDTKIDKDSAIYLAAMIAFYTGARAGEICALQWQDINFPLKTVYVRRGARRVKNNKGENVIEIGATKTATGTRSIPLLPQLEEVLKAILKETNPKPTDYLLGDKNDPSRLCGNFYSWAKRNDLIGKAGKPISLHGLRHTFATVSVQSGMDVKSLASILGHARADITLNIYASDDEDAKRIAMDNLANFFQIDCGNEL